MPLRVRGTRYQVTCTRDTWYQVPSTEWLLDNYGTRSILLFPAGVVVDLV